MRMRGSRRAFAFTTSAYGRLPARDSGTPESVIQKILGHKNAKSTEIYMNVAAQHVKKAVEGLSLTGGAK